MSLDDSPTPLVDYHAERTMLSIALHGRVEEFMSLPRGVFDHWKSDTIAQAIRTVVNNGHPVDAAVVARAITASLGNMARAQEINNSLLDMATTIAAVGEAAPYYAERLHTLYTLRKFKNSLGGIVGRVIYGTEADDELIKKSALDEAQGAIDEMREGLTFTEEATLSAQDYIDLEATPHDWLVPDLLEKTDRLILTGLEGTGKSTLLAQLACTIGAGIHPFLGVPLPVREYRTLIVDCENSPRQIQRRMRTICSAVDVIRDSACLRPISWREVVKIVSRPEGIHLTDPREYARLDHILASVEPDLVVIGPLYKMSKLDYRDEQAAKEVVDALDALRIRHQFALVTEAHTGHATDGSGTRASRPLGSSLFLRWPEFGLGLMPGEGHESDEHPEVVKVRRWRGSREERNWPWTLCHGDLLPWVPADGYRTSVPVDVEW